MGVFVMTSSKIGPFCDDVIKKRKNIFVCFLLMTSSQYIYVGLRPYIGKILGPKMANFDSLFLASLLRYENGNFTGI